MLQFTFFQVIDDLKSLVLSLEARVQTLEGGKSATAPPPAEEDDDDVDLFGSEDEEVSIEELLELMCEFEDYIQSVDVAAMNKI